MGDIGNFIDGRGLLTRSPFRSGYFVVASLMAVGCLLASAYIICRYWRAMGVYNAFVLGSLISVEQIYQWWRALRYYAKLRELYSGSDVEMREGSPLGIALRVAAGGIVDLLFYSYGTILFILILIGVLLGRLGVR